MGCISIARAFNIGLATPNGERKILNQHSRAFLPLVIGRFLERWFSTLEIRNFRRLGKYFQPMTFSNNLFKISGFSSIR